MNSAAANNDQQTVAIEAYSTMDRNTKKICDQVVSILADVNDDALQAMYRVGALLLKIENKPEDYHPQAMELLAAHLDRRVDRLKTYAVVAKEFTLQYILEHGKRAEKHAPLSFQHWVVLSTLEDKHRDMALAAVIKNGVSAAEFSRLVAAGQFGSKQSTRVGGPGRSVTPSANPISNLQKMVSLGKTLNNYLDTVPDHVVLPLESVAQAPETTVERVYESVAAIDGLLVKLSDIRTKLVGVYDKFASAQTPVDIADAEEGLADDDELERIVAAPEEEEEVEEEVEVAKPAPKTKPKNKTKNDKSRGR